MISYELNFSYDAFFSKDNILLKLLKDRWSANVTNLIYIADELFHYIFLVYFKELKYLSIKSNKLFNIIDGIDPLRINRIL